MSNHFSMGAINKITGDFEYPRIALKGNKYKCPSCEKDVIFRNGKIKQPHFAHYKSDNPCSYYEKPNESQIHKDAKMLMKKILDDKHNIFLNRKCNYCDANNRPFNYSDDYDIFSDEYTENTKAVVEYKFKYNDSNKSADVALIENDKIKYIFEICYKHKTLENNRPEPWFEIKADDLINKINSGEIIDEEGNISLECIRDYKCESCDWYEKERQKSYLEYIEQQKQKQLEENEIKNMEKEDTRTILRLHEKKNNEIELLRKKKYEKERIKKEQEKIKKEQEELIKLQKSEEIKKLTHNCGIMVYNICNCYNPKYELVKLSNNLFCNNCNKWKCRC